MRDWINLFEVQMTDGVWKNPSASELALLVKDQDMRGVGVGNDIWFDYAMNDTHFGIRNNLGLPEYSSGISEEADDGFDFYVCHPQAVYSEVDRETDFQDNNSGRDDWVWGSQEPHFALPGFVIFANSPEEEVLQNKAFARLVKRPALTEIAALPKWGGKKFPPRHVGPLDHVDDDDMAAVRYYTGHGYSPINAQLRGHDPDFARGTDDELVQDYGVALSNDEGIERIDRVIATAPKRKGKIRVFRGESKVSVTNQHLAMDIGQSYTDPAYLSTTFDPSRAFYSFAQLRREVGAGSNAISLYSVGPEVPGAYMNFPGEGDLEQEFVIARGCTYTLRDKKTIPVKNKGYPVTEITLLVWSVSPPSRPITETKSLSVEEDGKTLQMWTNPSAADISILLARGDLRGITDTVNLYVWEALKAIHWKAADLLFRHGVWKGEEKFGDPHFSNDHTFYFYNPDGVRHAKDAVEWVGKDDAQRHYLAVRSFEIAPHAAISIRDQDLSPASFKELNAIPCVARILRKAVEIKDA